MLTGDTLFIGDVGRPDLMASPGASAADLAGRLFDSVHEKLLTLPDETLVYPAHGAGSLCGKNLSKETFSTIGVQRRTNLSLRATSREEFVRLVTADQPETPGYFGYDADLNRRARATEAPLDDTLKKALVPLPLSDVLRAPAPRGDRPRRARPEAFAEGHLRGSVNVGLSGQYATWAGAHSSTARSRSSSSGSRAGNAKRPCASAASASTTCWAISTGGIEAGAGPAGGRSSRSRRVTGAELASAMRQVTARRWSTSASPVSGRRARSPVR